MLFEKQKVKFDYIFNFWGVHTLFNIISVNLYKSNKKYVFVHDSRYLYKRYVCFYKKYDYIFCVSNELKNKVCNVYKNMSDKIITLHNAIDVNNILLLSKEIGFRDNYNGCRILSVGRFDYIKGFDIIIKSCKILLYKGYNVKWYIIGDGYENENLKLSIKENNLEDRFVLLGEKENPYPFFKECDIYVQPSRVDSYSLPLSEAKIFNKPIVTTSFMGSIEQIKDKETGLFVETSPEGIAVGVQQLLDNKELREKLTNNLKIENQKPNHDYFAELKKYL